jgi:DNA-binding NarL/FixJ family response regulator
LGPALARFEEHGQQRLVAACRSLLGKAGAPVPRRRANSVVPLVLRERGVTERETEVLALLGEGLSNNEIASRLFLSPRTVERHIANLTAKTDLRTRTELVAFAARTGRG